MKKLFAFILIVTVLFCCSCASQKTVVYSGSLIDLPLLEQHSTDNALTTVGTLASIVGNERWIAYVDSEQRLLYTDKTGISHFAEQSFNQQGAVSYTHLPHEWNADFKKIMDDLNTRFGNIYSIYMGSNYWAVNYERDSTTRGTAYVKFNTRMYQIE